MNAPMHWYRAPSYVVAAACRVKLERLAGLARVARPTVQAYCAGGVVALDCGIAIEAALQTAGYLPAGEIPSRRVGGAS